MMKGGGDIHGCPKLEIKYFIIKNGSIIKIEPFSVFGKTEHKSKRQDRKISKQIFLN